MHKRRFIDLFAGIGGFRIAIERNGGNCVFTSEWDKHAQITYEANFGEKPEGDITKIAATDIPDHEILCAGFPCQAFSISGKQRGFEDTRGTLFFDVARIMAAKKPKVAILENVKNFARHDGGKTLRVVQETLENLGYVFFHKVLNASNYGLPTARERIFMVAFSRDLDIDNFLFPKPLTKVSLLKDALLSAKDTNGYAVKQCRIKMSSVVEPTPDVFGYYPQKPVRIGTINKGGQGDRIYSIYGHAITLSAYGGGNAAKTGAYLVDGVVRKLAPRECARIMGFPDSFVIPVSDGQAYKQFGNSVAVNVVDAVFRQVLHTLKLKTMADGDKQSVPRLTDDGTVVPLCSPVFG